MMRGESRDGVLPQKFDCKLERADRSYVYKAHKPSPDLLVGRSTGENI